MMTSKHEKGKRLVAQSTHWAIAREGITPDGEISVGMALLNAGEVVAFTSVDIPDGPEWDKTRHHFEEWLLEKPDNPLLPFAVVEETHPTGDLPWWLQQIMEEVFSK